MGLNKQEVKELKEEFKRLNNWLDYYMKLFKKTNREIYLKRYHEILDKVKSLEDWKIYYKNLYEKTGNEKYQLKFAKISNLLKKVHRENFKKWSGQPSKLDNIDESYLEKLLEGIIARGR